MTLRFFDVAAFIFVFCHFANTVEMIKKKNAANNRRKLVLFAAFVFKIGIISCMPILRVRKYRDLLLQQRL